MNCSLVFCFALFLKLKLLPCFVPWSWVKWRPHPLWWSSEDLRDFIPHALSLKCCYSYILPPYSHEYAKNCSYFPPPFTIYINLFLPIFATFCKSYQMFQARVSSLWRELGRPRQDSMSKARLAERDTVWPYSSCSVETVVFKTTLRWINCISIQFEMPSASENHIVNNRDTKLENTDTKNCLLQQTSPKPCL